MSTVFTRVRADAPLRRPANIAATEINRFPRTRNQFHSQCTGHLKVDTVCSLCVCPFLSSFLPHFPPSTFLSYSLCFHPRHSLLTLLPLLRLIHVFLSSSVCCQQFLLPSLAVSCTPHFVSLPYFLPSFSPHASKFDTITFQFYFLSLHSCLSGELYYSL